MSEFLLHWFSVSSMCLQKLELLGFSLDCMLRIEPSIKNVTLLKGGGFWGFADDLKGGGSRE